MKKAVKARLQRSTQLTPSPLQTTEPIPSFLRHFHLAQAKAPILRVAVAPALAAAEPQILRLGFMFLSFRAGNPGNTGNTRVTTACINLPAYWRDVWQILLDQNLQWRPLLK